MKQQKKNFLVITLAMIIVAAVLGAAWLPSRAVDNTLTEEDIYYAGRFLGGETASPQTFEDEIELIEKVQDAVLSRAPVNSGIPYDRQREPKDVFKARAGWCYDRSRVIEKILRLKGFRARHIFVYSTADKNAVTAFLTPGTPSHAITEVLTRKGWLVIDSNERWVSLDIDNNPRSMADVQERRVQWKTPQPAIYAGLVPGVFIYGLYSRHGRFYPPFDNVPDVNYEELGENF